MKSKTDDNILSQPSFRSEVVNGFLHEDITDYMVIYKLNMNQKTNHLEICKDRLYQILNDGDINLSMEKILRFFALADKKVQHCVALLP